TARAAALARRTPRAGGAHPALHPAPGPARRRPGERRRPPPPARRGAVTTGTGFEPGCLVGGEEQRGAGRIDVVYPYTGEVVGSAPELDRTTIRRALELAAHARVDLDRYTRGQVLERVAASIDAADDELADLITWESGLCLADTRHEVGRAIDVFRLAAHEALRDDGQLFAGDITPGGRRRRAFTTREPVRLVAAITPFNHPLNQLAPHLPPPLPPA